MFPTVPPLGHLFQIPLPSQDHQLCELLDRPRQRFYENLSLSLS